MTAVVEERDIDLIAQAISNGEIVAFPTETVYGLACKFNDSDALDKLMEAKERDYSKAVTLMLKDIDDIGKYGETDENIMKIARKFMPGRITLVLKRKKTVDPIMTNYLPTIGIRIPDSQFVLNLIDRTGPILVTSANLSGHPNTTNEKEVLHQLEGRISYVVKGQCSSALASTVVLLTDGKIEILREGLIHKKDIEEALL